MEGSILKNRTNAIVVDPTVLNTKERLMVFLDSMIYKEYKTFLPTSISSLIREKKWNQLITLLRQWEWTLDSKRSEEWFNSADFRDFCKELDKVCTSFERAGGLTSDEKSTLSTVRDILGFGSPVITDLAKELVTIAATKHAGIVSFTRHIKRWLKSLRGVVIFEISERTNAASAGKTYVKKRLRDAGLKGKIFMIFLDVVEAGVLALLLPSELGIVLKAILACLGKKAIIGLIMDGVP